MPTYQIALSPAERWGLFSVLHGANLRPKNLDAQGALQRLKAAIGCGPILAAINASIGPDAPTGVVSSTYVHNREASVFSLTEDQIKHLIKLVGESDSNSGTLNEIWPVVERMQSALAGAPVPVDGLPVWILGSDDDAWKQAKPAEVAP